MTTLEQEAAEFRAAKAKVFVEALKPYMDNLVYFIHDNLTDEDAYYHIYQKLVEAYALSYTSANIHGVKDYVPPPQLTSGDTVGVL